MSRGPWNERGNLIAVLPSLAKALYAGLFVLIIRLIPGAGGPPVRWNGSSPRGGVVTIVTAESSPSTRPGRGSVTYFLLGIRSTDEWLVFQVSLQF